MSTPLSPPPRGATDVRPQRLVAWLPADRVADVAAGRSRGGDVGGETVGASSGQSHTTRCDRSGSHLTTPARLHPHPTSPLRRRPSCHPKLPAARTGSPTQQP
eukprot:363309-Chlamydomonas_euryale.AAC.11